MAMDGADGTPMPCKSAVPNCVTDVGCIFMVALPPAYTPTSTPLAWSRVVYASIADVPSGVSVAPDLGPPIHA